MKIAVLDFNKGEVIIEEVPEKWKLLDGDDIVSEMGYRISDVEYMVITSDLDVTIDTNDCKLKINLK